ncbi:MAG: YidC/Oxa1 family membrane protein insertase [Clostridia bacterium]|nr:YidC/Oxa1 family membrane protein insertase [Clostridia bacterium]
MTKVLSWLATPLGAVIRLCYDLTGNYALAILLFVLFSKIILLPLSVWVQNNSIKLVKMQPEVNWLNVNHFGDAEYIAEEHAKIYKKYRYNVWIGLIPILVQFVLLLGIVQVIYNPLTYVLGIDASTVSGIESIASEISGISVEENAIQLTAVKLVKSGEYAAEFASVDAAVLSSISALQMSLFGLSLALLPIKELGITLIFPAIAAGSSWLLCFTQNKSQVLQAEQSNWNKYGVMAFSVGLSLYLGFGVPAGIAYYWTLSNLAAIAQMYLLNIAINPKKYVDYEELRKSQAALSELKALARSGKPEGKDPNRKREKADYKRFFHVANKHLVFYSEKSGFWKYYADIVEELLRRTNLKIHYITNDPDDAIFERAKTEPRLVPYYIGPRKLVVTLMKMDAEVVVMTTPDLNTYQLKRSYVKKDVEYIYTPHDMMSVHMGFRKGAMDHFDTVLCVGPQQMEEIRKTEEVYGLPEKKLIPCGYVLLDDLRRDFVPAPISDKPRILIAPSWQEDNLLDSVIDDLLSELLGKGYKITVRPHPEYVKRYRLRLDQLIGRYAGADPEELVFETDFSSNRSIWESDLLITDWSGISVEFSYTTERPCLFINTKIKCLNPEWEKLGITPLEIALRDQIGVSLEKDAVKEKAGETVASMLAHRNEWKETIAAVRDKNVFNPGKCGTAAADYIISALKKHRENNKK